MEAEWSFGEVLVNGLSSVGVEMLGFLVEVCYGFW